MAICDFYEITSRHVAGPNKNAQKAENIRTFLIPDRFIVPGSSPRRPRTIKIFAAFISAEWAYVVTDFSGLVRMHIRSKKTFWTEDDLSPGSDVGFVPAQYIHSLIISTRTSFSELSKVVLIGCQSPLSPSPRFRSGESVFSRNIADGKGGLKS